jgi:cytochrome P450
VPSVYEVARTLTRDIELHGRSFREGDRVLLLLAAANRDPRHFHDPNELDIHRQPNDHLEFGFGVHFCMGASLARMEACIALEELLANFADYRVTTREIEWLRTPAVRGPAALELEL